MAKKVRRVKKKNKRSAPAVKSADAAESTAEKAVEKAVPTKKEKAAVSFRLEYAYVVKDLRRLLLLSGALFLLLIVINLLFQ